MSVAVKKSSPTVIRPPEPLKTTRTITMRGTTIKLTSFDKVISKAPSTALLVFEHLGYKATQSIKKALSQALVLYYPLAGRIIPSGATGDEFSIHCTGKGVEFVTASVDHGLQEAKIFDESTSTKSLLDDLAIFYPDGSYGSFDDPLLSMQVTEFSCGGVVVGVTWNHVIADGAGIAQFLVAVGELARGSPSPSVIPTRSDEAVSSIPGPLPGPIRHATLMCPDTTDMDLIVPLDITVPSALINRVKAESHGCFDDGQPCTTFEAVLAVLWRCRVRAAMSNDVSPVYLTFTVNARKRVGAKEGYYGNCITTQPVAAATSGVVAEASIMELVRMIKRAKSQLHEKVITMGNDGRCDDEQLLRGLRRRYDMLNVTSWRNIGFERLDLGSGAPARVMSHTRHGGTPRVPACVMYPPCKGTDGINLLAHAVKEEHADAFLEELAKLEHGGVI